MKLLLVAVLILIIAAAAYLVLIMPRFRKPDCSALMGHFYAHRGFHNMQEGVPENSLTAFRRAVELGYGIELDVQLSADGIPVVFHDASLRRMCGVDKNVNELSLAQLKKLRLGQTEEKIPTFEEFLKLVDGRVPLIVEIKMEKRDDRIPEAVNRLLKGYQGVYCVESFHPCALIWYRKHRPDVFRGQLCTNFSKEHENCRLSYYLLGKMLTNIAARPDFVAYNWVYRTDLSRRICCNVYRALPVAWTIRSQEELDQCRNDFRLFIFEGFYPDGCDGRKKDGAAA